MENHDDSLEVGIAAGLDIPTALVLSDQADDEQPRKGNSWGRFVVAALIAGVVAVTVACLRRYVPLIALHPKKSQ